MRLDKTEATRSLQSPGALQKPRYGDPLSEVLSAARFEASVGSPSLLDADQSVSPAKPTAVLVAPLRGTVCVETGEADPVELDERSCAFFSLEAEQELTISPRVAGPTGVSPLVLTGTVTLDRADRALGVCDLFPSVLNGKPGDTLGRVVIDTLADEAQTNAPGSSLLVETLMKTLIVRCLRDVAPVPDVASRFIAAAMDRNVGPVLSLVHAHPDRDWTVQLMADHAGLSRSAFAERFAGQVGCAPIKYLRDVRFGRASELLATSHMSVADIAKSVGYDSESAFCAAFRKWAGMTPSSYRNSERQRGGSAPARHA